MINDLCNRRNVNRFCEGLNEGYINDDRNEEITSKNSINLKMDA